MPKRQSEADGAERTDSRFKLVRLHQQDIPDMETGRKASEFGSQLST
jgi:hypothetical protein